MSGDYLQGLHAVRYRPRMYRSTTQRLVPLGFPRFPTFLASTHGCGVPTGAGIVLSILWVLLDNIVIRPVCTLARVYFIIHVRGQERKKTDLPPAIMDYPASPHNKYFHPVDYVVFVLMFIVSISIGAFFAFRSRNKNTTDEYLMGGRKLGLLPVTISICVSVVSANTLLGAPAEMYTYGIMYEFANIAIILSTIIVAIFIVPLIYPLKLTSAHKYLHLRFGSKAAQYVGTFLLLLTQTLYIGCVIFGPATALETVTGIPPWASIIFVGVIGTGYTAFGGMKAVIWTDVFQSSVMLAGLIAMIVQGSRKVGGFSYIWKANRENGRLDINLSASLTERFSLYASVISLTTYWVGGYGVNQPCVQRYCAMDSVGKGKLTMLLNGPGFIMFTTLSMMAGMVAFAYYDMKRCDPLAAGFISNGNQITPYFVMDILGYPGLPGLFISSLFSGSLSTLSSSINSMAAVVWEDILVDNCRHLSENTKTWITKGASVFFGVVCMGVSFMIMAIGGNLIQLAASFFGMAIGPLLGIFMLGALFPFANWIGAVVGAGVGIGVNIWLMVGQTLMKSQRKRLPTKIDGCFATDLVNGTSSTLTSMWTEASDATTTSSVWTNGTIGLSGGDDQANMSTLQFLYSISFSWYPFIGFLTVIIVGVLVSVITFCLKQNEVDNKLLFPCVRLCKPKGTYSIVERSTSFAYEASQRQKPLRRSTRNSVV